MHVIITPNDIVTVICVLFLFALVIVGKIRYR